MFFDRSNCLYDHFNVCFKQVLALISAAWFFFTALDLGIFFGFVVSEPVWNFL